MNDQWSCSSKKSLLDQIKLRSLTDRGGDDEEADMTPILFHDTAHPTQTFTAIFGTRIILQKHRHGTIVCRAPGPAVVDVVNFFTTVWPCPKEKDFV